MDRRRSGARIIMYPAGEPGEKYTRGLAGRVGPADDVDVLAGTTGGLGRR